MTSRLNAENPIVDDTGRQTQVMRTFVLELSNNLPIVGVGSPEGVVLAPVYSLYIDSTGTTGTIEYRKMQEDIGGDKTKGWVLL